MYKTREGANQYEFSMNHCLEFFSKAGSLFEERDSFYGGEESALSLFQKAWVTDKITSMKLALWLRDCRGGAGNRSGARSIFKWLGDNDPEWIIANIDWIPRVGRWDDLRALFGTVAEKAAIELWVNAIKDKNVLAAKWAKREDFQLRKALGLKIKPFRKLLASIRKDHIVEHKMCHNLWKEIQYDSVPSVAMARYTMAFSRHDYDRFVAYKEVISNGTKKIHSKALFPHDCVRTAMFGDEEIANAQFDALPNFLEGTNEKIIVISDTSASMSVFVSGSIRAVDVSEGMALYCSAKIPRTNPFHKKFIAFCSESEFKDWNGLTFSQAVHSMFDGAIGGTRIDKALMLILKTATFFKLSQDQLPTTLLIISDMQFHAGTDGSDTEVRNCLKKFKEAGYEPPRIVYWNLAGYPGSPEVSTTLNVGLISGFSPSILRAVFKGEDFSPLTIMNLALEKYVITIPNN